MVSFSKYYCLNRGVISNWKEVSVRVRGVSLVDKEVVLNMRGIGIDSNIRFTNFDSSIFTEQLYLLVIK